jgi:Flp pilus assembly protein TadB
MRLRLPSVRERPLPARPFRDSAIAYAVMAAIVVVIGLVTGGGVARALVIAVAFFVLATGWSWWRFRSRIEQRDRR